MRPKKMENARKTKLSRKGVQMICRRCGTVGHNSRGCKGIGCEPRPRLQRKTMTRDGGANDQDIIQSTETQPTMQERDEVYNFVYGTQTSTVTSTSSNPVRWFSNEFPRNADNLVQGSGNQYNHS